jgi:SHAQKYF class myb-like DNA-binding protein
MSTILFISIIVISGIEVCFSIISISKEQSEMNSSIKSSAPTDCLVPITSSVSVVSWNDTDIKEMQQKTAKNDDESILQTTISLSNRSSSNIACYLTYTNDSSAQMSDSSQLILMAAASLQPKLIKRTKRKRCVDDENDEAKKRQQTSGRWTPDEHDLFLLGMSRYGRDWKAVAKHIPTRSSTQVRSHAQKYFLHDRSEQQQKKNRKKSLTPVVILNSTSPPDTKRSCHVQLCPDVNEREWIATALLALRDSK